MSFLRIRLPTEPKVNETLPAGKQRGIGWPPRCACRCRRRNSQSSRSVALRKPVSPASPRMQVIVGQRLDRLGQMGQFCLPTGHGPLFAPIQPNTPSWARLLCCAPVSAPLVARNARSDASLWPEMAPHAAGPCEATGCHAFPLMIVPFASTDGNAQKAESSGFIHFTYCAFLLIFSQESVCYTIDGLYFRATCGLEDRAFITPNVCTVNGPARSKQGNFHCGCSRGDFGIL